MPDEQDRAEALDDEKAAFEDGEPPGLDELLSDDDLDGTSEETDDANDDPFHREEPAPEVAAMHLTDDP